MSDDFYRDLDFNFDIEKFEELRKYLLDAIEKTVFAPVQTVSIEFSIILDGFLGEELSELVDQLPMEWFMKETA